MLKNTRLLIALAVLGGVSMLAPAGAETGPRHVRAFSDGPADPQDGMEADEAEKWEEATHSDDIEHPAAEGSTVFDCSHAEETDAEDRREASPEPSRKGCRPVAKRRTLTLPITTSPLETAMPVNAAGMTDTTLLNKHARLSIHHVYPICAEARCAHHGRKSIIAVHGRSVDPVTALDLRYGNYSLMVALARAGFNVYAPSFVGFGKSSRFMLDDPCNATLAEQATFLVNFNNPISQTCGADSSAFTTNEEQVHELQQVVKYVQRVNHNPEVHLLGFSNGGSTAGVYTLQHAEDIKSVFFIAPQSASAGAGAERPANSSTLWNPKRPLELRDRTTGMLDNFKCYTGGTFGNGTLANCCPGQRDLAIDQQIWDSLRAYDALGSKWGSQDPILGGVLRAPRRVIWGWVPATQSQFARPAMLVRGELDNNINPVNYRNMVTALGSAIQPTPAKIVLNVPCASHGIVWEKEAHAIVRDAALEWFLHQTYRGHSTGEFRAAP